MASILCAARVSEAQDSDSSESVAELRLELDRIRRDYESRLASLERRESAVEANDDLVDRRLSARLDAFRRQLELRVPGYEALPDNAESALLAEIRDRQILDNLVTFHGYARSGFGTSGRGTDQEIFRAPEIPTKYRLGNENDTYVELALERTREVTDGIKVRGELMLAMQTLQNQTFDPTDNFLLRQSYIEMWGLPMFPEWRFWAGNRYYDRHDIHIVDYFFLDMSGYGGGVMDIPFCGAKLAIAYIGGALEFPTTNRGRIADHNLDVRLSDIPTPCGKLMIWALGSSESGGISDADGKREPHKSGHALGALHVTEELLGGFAKTSVQWGSGASSNFSSSVNAPFDDINLDSQLQLTNTLTAQFCEWLMMQGTTIYRRTEQPDFEQNVTHWVSGGVRPIVHLTQHGAVALEYGVDYVDSGPIDKNGTVQKLTLSPMLRVDNNFFSRPELRTFVTYAWWSDSFRGLVGGDSYALTTEGLSSGVQFEHWW